MSDKRIAYYTKKVARLGEIHISKRTGRWYNRMERLKQYKFAMHQMR